MKTNVARAGKTDWREVDARVLGRIVAAQNIEFALPDTTRIAEFFAETLLDIPGIASCRVCLDNVTIQKGGTEIEICEECRRSRNKAAERNEMPSFADFKCKLADQPGTQFNAIESLYHHFGFFVFQVDDAETFNVYKPFIGNLSNYVAISLENRMQRGLLQQARNELELKVKERTQELVAVNAQLQEEIENRKRAEDEIRKLNTELEQRVRDRTAELEATNRELEAFSYSVSHDLRAPLRAIDGYRGMLIEDCAERLDSQGRRLLDVISSETDRMGRLIDNLLAFSHLGRKKLETCDVDMAALAQDVFAELAARTPERALRLEMKPLPAARGDRAMIRVVLGNLLSNAVKFTRQRDPAVIEVGSREEDGRTVYYVKDNGVGFDMQYADKLFGVFQRLHSAEAFEGSGVGLALVQRVIHRHGGRVWAEGIVNGSATFSFSLPNLKGSP